MARNAHKILTAAGEVVGRACKLRHCYIAVTGDRIWELRQNGAGGNIVYKVSCAVNIPHTDLDLNVKTNLHATVLSGTTGELNVLYE